MIQKFAHGEVLAPNSGIEQICLTYTSSSYERVTEITAASSVSQKVTIYINNSVYAVYFITSDSPNLIIYPLLYLEPKDDIRIAVSNMSLNHGNAYATINLQDNSAAWHKKFTEELETTLTS